MTDIEGTDSNVNPRRRLWRSIAFLGSVGLALILVWLGREDLAALRFVGLPSFVAMVLIQFAYLFSQSERLRLVVEDHSDARLSITSWSRIFLVGRLLNSLLIQSGNVYRLVTLKKSHGVPAAQYASSLAAQMWISVSIALFLATVLSVPSGQGFEFDKGTTLGLGLLSVGAMSAPFMANRVGHTSWIKRRGWRVVDVLTGILDRTTRTVAKPRLAVQLLAHTLIGFISGAAILVLAYRATGSTLPWFVAATLLAFLQIANLVVITPGNLGVQELGFAAISGLLGYTGAIGVVASAAVRLSGIVALGLATVSAETLLRLSAVKSRKSRSGGSQS